MHCRLFTPRPPPLPRDPWGQAKWLFAGLVAPGVVWRLQSLLAAIEVRGTVEALLGAFQARGAAQGERSDDSTGAGAGDESVAVTAPALVVPSPGCLVRPPPMLLLEAITPAACGEALTSERLEVR